MKLNKKLLSFFLIAVFAIVLVACGGDGTTLQTTETQTTEQQTTETQTTEEQTTETPTTAEQTTEEQSTVDLSPVLDQVVDMYEDTLGNDEFVAVEDIEIISYIGDYYVNWMSSNTKYLGHDGSVTRPLLSEGDQTVIFTVKVTDGVNTLSHDFFVTVKALEVKTGQEIANEVFLVATAFPTKTFWSSADELTFVETAEDADGNVYDVTWTSSNEEIISLDGKITQPEDADVDVTITAKITVGEGEEAEEFTKELVFTVAKLAEGEEVTTIADAIAKGQDAYVEILGVTVIAKYSSGDVFFTDGTDILYIYSPSFTAEVGGVYDITGYIDFYYNAPQLAGDDLKPLKIADSDAEAKTAPVIENQTVSGVINDVFVPSEENPHRYLTYEVTGAIYYEESWGNYSVFLVPSDYDFDADLQEGATQPNGNAIMIYYRSDMDVLKAFHGKEVTIDIVMQGYRTDKSVFYANFFGSPLDVDITIADDQEAVSTALNALLIDSPILEDMTLQLPTELYGVSLTWTSSNETVINPTTGFVDVASLTTQVDVTLTVQAVRGEATGSKTFDLEVGELPVTSIEDVLEASEGTFLIEGTLISGEYYNTFFIQDATGNIAIYTNGNAAITSALNDNLGNVVKVVGTRAAYKGLEQVKATEVTFVSESTVPDPTNLNDVVLTEENLADYQGQLIELTNMIVTEASTDGYDNVYLTLKSLVNDSTINVKWDSRTDLPTELENVLTNLEVGASVNIVTPLGWADGPLLYVTTSSELTEVVLSDDQKIAADKAALNFGGNVFVEYTETLPLAGTNGSAIAWAITADEDSYATLNAETGEFTIAAPTGDATVVLTATLTLGEATDTAVITFTLIKATPVDLGDFESQEMDATVAIHGVVYAVIGNGFFVEDATGQLFVFSYDAEYNEGDEVELVGKVAEYNGSYQLADLVALPEALSTGNDIAMEAILYDDSTVLVPGQVYTVIGEVAIEGQYDNVYIYLNETDKFAIYYQSPSVSIEALEAEVGNTIVVDVIYYNDDTVFAYVNGAEGISAYAEVTDFTELNAMTEGEYTLVDGTYVLLTGVVTGNSYDGLFLQDANGVGFFLYKPFEDGVQVGDEVTYLGVLSEYNGARQLTSNPMLIEVVSTGNDLVVTSVTADEIDAFTKSDAGTIYSFDGFTLDSIDGSHMILGYTLADGVTTGTVKVRYYTNWNGLELIADNYENGDALPGIQFILYNFRDDETQLDVVSVPELEAAVEAFSMTLDNALDFEYVDYTYNIHAQIVNGFVLDNAYVESELLAYNSEMGIGILHDLARFLGAIYRATDSTVTAIMYDGVEYTWNEAGTLAGSNWEDELGVTLVSVITDDFLAGELTNSLVVTLVDADNFMQDLTLNFAVEMDVNPVVVDELKETFTNSTAGTTYGDGSFVGDNGITWTFVASRDANGDDNDSGIELPAIMLRRSSDNSAITSSTISGGISFIEVKLYKGFTGGGDRQVEIFINGVSVGTSTPFDDFNEHVVRIENINVEGDFTIEIKNITGKQVIIDDITWGAYEAE